jgi:hypothetical protein
VPHPCRGFGDRVGLLTFGVNDCSSVLVDHVKSMLDGAQRGVSFQGGFGACERFLGGCRGGLAEV